MERSKISLQGLFRELLLPVNLLTVFVWVLILAGLFLVSQWNFLFFHTFVELAGIAVAFSIFLIVWNTRRRMTDGFFLIVGISFLFTGGIDLVHTIAYKGMGVLPGNGADIPTQLWIAARYFQSIAFLAATFFIGRPLTRERKFDIPIIIASCCAALVLILASIFVWQDFPHAYLEGTGLTLFKIASEYVISAILVATIVILYLKREKFDRRVWELLVAAQVFLILGEIAFTSYVSVFDFANMLGHLFRLLSVYFFYRAFVVVAITRPFDLLFLAYKRDADGQSRLASIVENSDDAILSETLDGIITSWNAGAEKIYGFSAAEAVGKHISLIVPPGYSQEAGKILDTVERGEHVRHREAQRMRKDGTIIPVAITASPVRDAEGTITGASIIARDITEVKRAEDALKESEQKYRTLFENMIDGFAYCRMIYDAEGRPADWIYLDVNPAFGRLTGLTGIQGRRVLEAIPGIREQTPELFAVYGRVASTGVSESFEINFTPLGMWLKVSVHSPEKGYFVAVFEDITARKKAEEAVREAAREWQTTFDAITDVVFLIDNRSRIVKHNRAFEEFTGRSAGEIDGQPCYLILHGIYTPIEGCPNQKAILSRKRESRELQINNRWYNALVDPIITPEGEVTGAVHLIIDITERKLDADALQQANRKLNLLSSITRHDIRNQLLALKAYLELSRMAVGDEEKLGEYISREEKAATAIERQISFTKEYEDLGVRAPAWQDAESCVGKALAVLPVKKIRVAVDFRGLEIYADPLFEKVFYNLIDNALRYGGEGMTSIRFSSAESEKGLVITVQDDGRGIAEEDRKRLFERGFGHNTGLGLFLSREILAITGITIAENGTPGKGARFEITVPKAAYRFTGTG